MSGTRNQPLKEEQLEEGQIEEMSSSDRALIEAFMSPDQVKQRILLGDYHPNAFKKSLSEKLKRDSFSFGDAGLFKRNSDGDLVLDTTEALDRDTLETGLNTIRNSK